MKHSFLSSTQQGQNAVWRYLCGILLAIVLGFIGFQWVGMPVAQAIARNTVIFNPTLHSLQLDDGDMERVVDASESFYISMHIAYAFFCVGILASVKYLHQRKTLTLISSTATFSLQRWAIGFCLWFVAASLQTLIEFLHHATAFSWNGQLVAWRMFLPWAIVCTPIQTSAEELLFRGYLLQGLGLVIRQPVILTLVASLPFAIAHFGNPEMERGAIWIGITYFVMAVFLTWITLQDNRLELALGVHAANNLFVVLVVNTTDSALPTPSLFLQHTPTDPRFTLVTLVGAIVLFYGIIFHLKKTKTTEASRDSE